MNDYVTRKDLNELKAEIKDEFRRHTGILLEEYQHRVNLVIDGQEDIKRDVAVLKKDVAVLKEDVKEIRNGLAAHRDNTEMHVQKAKRTKKSSA